MSSNKPGQSAGPQLRNSCDSCNLAKVKCTKTKPRCKRCDGRNEACTYSISLRSVSRKHQYPGNCLSAHGGMDVTRKCIIDGKVVDTSMLQLSAQSLATPPLSDIGEMEVFDVAAFDPPSWTQPNFQEMHLDDPDNLLAQYVNGSSGGGSSTADASIADTDMSLISPLDLTGMDQHPQANMHSSADHHHNHQQHLHYTQDPACACHQTLLTKLAELSALPTAAHSLAFDAALSTNKSILATCADILQCCTLLPQHHHQQRPDTPLLLSLCALLTHAIRAFDSLITTRRERKLHPQSSMHSQSHPQTHSQLHPQSPTSIHHPQHPFDPHHPFSWDSHLPSPAPGSITIPTPGAPSGGRRKSVRLMLGSYQLDREDEEVLQGSLIRIELGKIERVLDVLEGTFGGDAGAQSNRSGSGNEDDALVRGLVGYLRGKVGESAGAV